MSNPTIIKKLYKATSEQTSFSINDMRDHGIHNEFRKKNQIGSFFRWMNSIGYTKATGTARVQHVAGNKRWIWQWTWTEKAHQEFGGKLPNGQLRLF